MNATISTYIGMACPFFHGDGSGHYEIGVHYVEPKSREQYVAEGGTNIPEYNPVAMWPYDCTINAFRAILSEFGLNRTI
jgi:hypothetical protein